MTAALAKRKFWVVEGVPHDKYYLYGKIELWIDAESWIGAFNRKYSWKNELLNTYQVTGYLNHPTPNPDERDRVVLELAVRLAVRGEPDREPRHARGSALRHGAALRPPREATRSIASSTCRR